MRNIFYRISLTIILISAAVSCEWQDPLAGLAGPEHEVIKPISKGFTVMSYNIYGARGLKLDADYLALASVIRQINPDFVLIQEVDSCTTRQGDLKCNSAIKLKEVLDSTTIDKWYYNYSPADYNLYNLGGAYGDAVLSRHEILWEKDYQMDYAPEHATQKEREKRSVGIIKVKINNRDVYIGCTHFDHLGSDHSRISQAYQLKDIVNEYEGEILILGGDFNSEPDSKTMEIISEYMIPSYTDLTQYTFPSQRTGTPTKMIDYVMCAKYSTGITCTSSKVLNNAASDHCAVYATYSFVE